jgi:predicted RNase H-like nuclease (RuvC/YqgF family)
MEFDLSLLSDADKDELVRAVLEKTATGGEPMEENAGEQTDIEQDEATIAPLVQALEYLVEKIEALEAKVCQLDKTVMEDIIGGITNLYDENIHTQKKAGIKAKYGKHFEPFEGALKELYPDDDIYESLMGEIESMKGGEGYTEDGEGSKVQEIADRLKEKLSKASEAVGGPKATVAEVTVEKTSGDDDLMKEIDRLKKSGNPRLKR